MTVSSVRRCATILRDHVDRPIRAIVPLVSVALLPACLVNALEATEPTSDPGFPRHPDSDALADPPEDHPAHPSFTTIRASDLVEIIVGREDDEGEAPPESVDEPDGGPLAGYSLYLDPDSHPARQASAWRDDDPDGAALMDRLAAQPTALWLGDWNADVAETVDDALTTAADQLRVFVVYNIPNRDCGSYSSGGASDVADYAAFIDDIARGLAGRTAVVILEPDAVALTHCLDADQVAERLAMLSAAVDTLTEAGALVYIDAGDSAWISAAEMAEGLLGAGVHNAAGFALNVAHTESTPDTIDYAEELREILGDVHYIADTGRNGAGPDDDHNWCNPLGRAIGEVPSLATGIPGLDATLWVKPPGESDGDCNGGPSAGAWWADYARGLVERG